MSYRSSLYPGAFNSSAASSASSSSPSPAATLLMEKQREYTAFAQVCAHAEHLAHFLDSFADKYEVLDGGSEAVGDVVEHWQNVFRVTGLALASLADKRAALATPSDPSAPQPTEADVNNVVLPPGTLPDKLVRIPVRQPDDEGSVGLAGSAQASGTSTPGST
ncbi:hypothetical protein NBRC10512_003959 [Rhodotorula toruloides]|uniref:DASH complex subunit DAD2 n=2 Tax=Rhodotorula toruloides TaxID=5286 RepID=A0A061B7N4_RHOTO|nr:DASH complex, subunit Dad2 [Rhodotorula toruloides NP11]EMS25164.1 DASH complex, subunit Dad2 [Rhodotorula toruloides NP11]KAJ8295398.1 hypothetical protein OF846_001635 [Rhodotorula toruloides]CDR42908.1 RHTO0S07e05380g1_1 [Rhodotorula toruloides]